MLTTQRLILRRAEKEDLPQLYKMVNQATVQRYHCLYPMTHEELALVIERDRQSEFVFYLEEKQNHEFIGVVYTEQDSFRYGLPCVALSYFLDDRFTRQGYMSEALDAILGYLFSKGIEVISARTMQSNQASIGLLQKCGFVQEGILRHVVRLKNGQIENEVLFSMLKTDYEPLQTRCLN